MDASLPKCKISWWDRLLPGELLYSYAARLSALNVLGSSRKALDTLFGSATMTLSPDVPSHLADVFAGLEPSAHFRSIDDMVQRTTLYPYYRFFMPQERWGSLMEIARSNQGNALKTVLGLVAGRCGAAVRLRSCAVCSRSMVKVFGVCYWHRMHQLPGVSACAIHGTRLDQRIDLGVTAHRQRLMLPGDTDMPARPDSMDADPVECRLAWLSAEVLQFVGVPPEPKSRRSTYLNAMRERSLLDASGRILWQPLIEQLNAHFSGKLLGDALPGRRGWSSTLTWTGSVLSPKPRLVHPLAHLMLIDFLFGGFEKFVASALNADPPARRVQATVQSRDVARPNEVLLDTSLSCRQASVLLGCCVATVVKQRSQLGVPVHHRPSRVFEDVRSQIAGKLRDGLEVVEVAKAHGVSISTAYRILEETVGASARRKAAIEAMRPSYRAKWMASCSAVQQPIVSSARRLVPAVYAWLFRNDRQWLGEISARIPAGQTSRAAVVDWRLRDAVLAEAARAVVLKHDQSKSGQKISKTRLLKLVYNETSARRNARKLPSFWRVVKAVSPAKR